MGFKDRGWITPSELYERALDDVYEVRRDEQENDPQSKLERLTPTKIYQWLTKELPNEYRQPIVDYLFCSDRAWTRYGDDFLRHHYIGEKKVLTKEEIATLNTKIPSIQSIFKRDGKIDQFKAKSFLRNYHKRGRCNSLWCSACRDRASQNYQSKIKEHLEWDGDLKKGYYHVTGTIGVTEIDHTSVQEMIDKDGEIWRKIRRYIANEKNFDLYTNPWIEVVYEYELVNWRFLQHSKTKSPQKVKECEQLRVRDKVSSPYMFYIHFHALTNIPKDRHSEVFKKYYWLDDRQPIFGKNEDGIYVQKVRGKTPSDFDKSIKKLTSYPFKNPTRFKHSFVGNDFTNGEKFNSKELSWIFALYENLQGVGFKSLRRSLFSNKARDKIWFQRECSEQRLDNTKNCIGVFTTAIHMDRYKEGREWFFHPHYPHLRIPIYKNIYGSKSYTLTSYPTFIPFNRKEWRIDPYPIDEPLPNLSEEGWDEHFDVPSEDGTTTYKVYPNRSAAKDLYKRCKKANVVNGPLHFIYADEDNQPFWNDDALLYIINGKWRSKEYFEAILRNGMELREDAITNLKERLSKTFYEKGIPHIKYDWGEEEGDDVDVIEDFIG